MATATKAAPIVPTFKLDERVVSIIKQRKAGLSMGDYNADNVYNGLYNLATAIHRAKGFEALGKGKFKIGAFPLKQVEFNTLLSKMFEVPAPVVKEKKKPGTAKDAAAAAAAVNAAG